MIKHILWLIFTTSMVVLLMFSNIYLPFDASDIFAGFCLGALFSVEAIKLCDYIDNKKQGGSK